ncbi:MAG TPA: ABC transporter permease [Bryobacteraceae bacterium]|nr:ABC transporter permease [Bryobacteraceae bacterium]
MFWRWRRRTDEDFSAEIAAHIDLEAQRLESEGLAPDAARAAALRAFGNTTKTKERFFEGTRIMWLNDCSRDLQYAVRTLRRSRGFAAVVILTLALGMGANTAVLSLVNTFALQPLPVPEPEALVHVGKAETGGALFSYLDYRDYLQSNTTLSGLAALNKTAVALGDAPPGPADGTEPLTHRDRIFAFGLIVTANYFEVLGARTELGRTFTAEEDRMPNGNAVIVLSHSFWERRMQSDRSIVGKTIRLSGQPFTVVGIMASDFVGTEPQIPDFWAPVTMRDALVGGWHARTWSSDRDARCLGLLGRLRPGVTRQQAQADLRVIERRLAAQYPSKERKVVSIRVTDGSTFYNLEDYRPLVLPVFAAIGLVLLVACANVANLLLSRMVTRQREVSIRLAMGSSRGRLMRQLLTESVLLATIGGLVAMGLSLMAIHVVSPIILNSLPLPDGLAQTIGFNVRPDWRTFGLTMLLSLATAILFGLLPALESVKSDVNSGLKGSGSASGTCVRKGRIRDGLVVAQVAFSATLMICAGLITRNVKNLELVDTGLQTKDVYAVAVGSSSRSEKGQTAQLRRALSEHLAALSGTVSIGEAGSVPLSGGMPTIPVSLPGRSVTEGATLSRATYAFVSPGYFEVLRLRVLRGRIFSQAEANAKSAVVVVSESTARRWWPGEDPIGKRITLGMIPDASKPVDRLYLPERVVTGVVPDVRTGIVWRRDGDMIYVPVSVAAPADAYLLVRMQGGGDAKEIIHREAGKLSGHPAVSVRAINDTLEYQLSPFRALATLASVLGGLALLLASIGIFGVISYLVEQRTKEFGIRLALGAPRSNLLGLVVRSGLRLAAAGMLLGTLAGMGASQIIASVLTDVSQFDPAAFGGVAIVLMAVAFAACVTPAMRAARVDPLNSLRYD